MNVVLQNEHIQTLQITIIITLPVPIFIATNEQTNSYRYSIDLSNILFCPSLSLFHLYINLDQFACKNIARQQNVPKLKTIKLLHTYIFQHLDLSQSRRCLQNRVLPECSHWICSYIQKMWINKISSKEQWVKNNNHTSIKNIHEWLTI